MKLEAFTYKIGTSLSRISKAFVASPEYAAGVLFGIFVLLIVLAVLIFWLGRIVEKAELSGSLRSARKDAVKRSRAVLSGQMAEQIAPFLKDFPCNPADVRFVGKPIDFIGFPGAADGKEIKEILFIEVKTGNSALSAREKEIRDAIKARRIRYVEYNPEIDFEG